MTSVISVNPHNSPVNAIINKAVPEEVKRHINGAINELGEGHPDPNDSYPVLEQQFFKCLEVGEGFKNGLKLALAHKDFNYTKQKTDRLNQQIIDIETAMAPYKTFYDNYRQAIPEASGVQAAEEPQASVPPPAGATYSPSKSPYDGKQMIENIKQAQAKVAAYLAEKSKPTSDEGAAGPSSGGGSGQQLEDGHAAPT